MSLILMKGFVKSAHGLPILISRQKWSSADQKDRKINRRNASSLTRTRLAEDTGWYAPERRGRVVIFDAMSISEGRVATIRPMQSDDLTIVEKIHRRCLHSGFFVELGRHFLNRYYETFLSSPHSVALVAEIDGVVVGAIVGTRNNRAHYRWVVQNRRLRLAILGALHLTIRPKLAYRFATTRAVRYARSLSKLSRSATPVESNVANATLTHIAVSSEARGAGLGRQLVEAYVVAVRKAGDAKAITLVTRSDETGACEFYRRLGWTKVGETTDMDGVRFCRLRLELN